MKILPINGCISVLAVVLLTTTFGLQAKVYRWVDEQGNVHYTETLPPDFKDKKTDVLDAQGITRETDQSLVPPPPPPPPKENEKGELQRDSSGMKRPEPRYTPAQLKIQQDALLLLRYDSDQEILDAMQVEINQLDYDKLLLTTSRASMQEAYAGNVREAADRQRAGMAVEPEKIKEIQSLKRRLANNAASISSLTEREEKIRASFAQDLERYRTLIAEREAQE